MFLAGKKNIEIQTQDCLVPQGCALSYSLQNFPAIRTEIKASREPYRVGLAHGECLTNAKCCLFLLLYFATI